MPSFAQDQKIIQDLALKYREIAENPVNEERKNRARRINGLHEERPIVLIDELPWHELDVDHQLTLRCEDPFARSIEQYIRRVLLSWKYFQGDMVVEKHIPFPQTFNNPWEGLTVQEQIQKNRCKKSYRFPFLR